MSEEATLTRATELKAEKSRIAAVVDRVTKARQSGRKSLFGITDDLLNRENADRHDKQYIDSLDQLAGKVAALNLRNDLQRARRDINIARMSVLQRITAALSTLNIHTGDIDYKLSRL